MEQPSKSVNVKFTRPGIRDADSEVYPFPKPMSCGNCKFSTPYNSPWDNTTMICRVGEESDESHGWAKNLPISRKLVCDLWQKRK